MRWSGATPDVKVLVAPDSFKGTFPAVAVADAIARGLERAGVEADRCPVADGGEGTLDALLVALGGRVERVTVRGPLGDPVEACFALLGDGRRALLEMASASGLALVSELDPWAASTYGTGQLIRAAVEAGAREVLVGVGGSATVDGGRGALEAIADAGGMAGAQVVVLCDVRTAWERCAEIYGPQKGADEAMVARLAARLDAFASELERDPRGIPMTGAAGGLSGGLWGGLGAELQPGAPYVLDALGFDERLRDADAIVVAEGRIDAQSAMGKIVGEIAGRARRRAGARARGPQRALRRHRPGLGHRGHHARRAGSGGRAAGCGLRRRLLTPSAACSRWTRSTP
jgi:glycerate kinase